MFFKGLAGAGQLQHLKVSIKLTDHYFGGIIPTSESWQMLKETLEKKLINLRTLFLSTYEDDIEEVEMREDDYDRSSNEDLIYGAFLWKEGFGCLKTIRVFSLGRFQSSKWSILDFVSELRDLTEIKIYHDDGKSWGCSQQLAEVTVTMVQI